VAGLPRRGDPRKAGQRAGLPAVPRPAALVRGPGGARSAAPAERAADSAAERRSRVPAACARQLPVQWRRRPRRRRSSGSSGSSSSSRPLGSADLLAPSPGGVRTRGDGVERARGGADLHVPAPVDQFGARFGSSAGGGSFGRRRREGEDGGGAAPLGGGQRATVNHRVGAPFSTRRRRGRRGGLGGVNSVGGAVGALLDCDFFLSTPIF
jgi:hypothetical protein